ncbi:hypothetical protein CAEBREN_07035 [Caenorhabditis brenneri]|uniref:Uncharacterized protein n=1 Tax=Caenorhabditis brenneri TaxID=135651 RepID=G0P7V0_CAEBE|nr:hypothetical protein CAEBREN_07035 [Caenorhabditis brenneri]
MFDKVVEFDFSEILLLLSSIFLSIVQYVKNKDPLENFIIYLNCLVYLTYFMLSHMATIILTLCGSPVYFAYGGYATNVYYLPFLWIVSVYIVGTKKVKKWKKRKEEEKKEIEFHLAYITVGYS